MSKVEDLKKSLSKYFDDVKVYVSDSLFTSFVTVWKDGNRHDCPLIIPDNYKEMSFDVMDYEAKRLFENISSL